ncbi:MAG: restriction endonuclease subunit S [Spirochaetaceae bacterium]|nr:restriction endonuclease subunit S [Spirochaetaceae bacterium]
MKNSGVEWIGEIPEDWEVSKILNCLRKRISDGPHETPKYVETGIPFISVDSLNDTEYVDFSFVNRFISDEDYFEYNKKTNLEENDILFSKAATIGKTAIVHADEKFMVWSPIAILKTNNSLDNRFLYFLLNYDGLITHISYLGSINTQINVGMRELEQARIPLPPKETQQRIAAYLDKKCSKIEETIQNQQQVIEKLKAYKQSLITEAVTGKVKIVNGKACGEYESYKDSGEEWIGKIPSEWEVGKFGRFAQVKSNLVDPNLYLEYPQIAPDNIGKGSGKLIDWQTVKDSGVISWNHLFFKGQIVYSKIRPTLNKLIIAPFDGLCSADMYPIETNMYKQFFVYMMLSQYFVEQVGLITRDRVKMPKINQNELSGILITVPTKEEQKEISDYLDKKCTAIDTAIEQKQELIVKLTEYKKSLIYECVTGKKEI